MWRRTLQRQKRGLPLMKASASPEVVIHLFVIYRLAHLLSINEPHHTHLALQHLPAADLAGQDKGLAPHPGDLDGLAFAVLFTVALVAGDPQSDLNLWIERERQI